MDTGISILKYVRELLLSDENLKKVIADKVFPLVAEESTMMPFVVLKKDSVSPSYTKEGCLYDYVEFSVQVVADSYRSMVDICETIRRILENKENERLSLVRVSSISSEEYTDDAYVQEISFNAVFNIKN